MSREQLFTVDEFIKDLKQMYKPNDKIIIDWITAEDIRNEITDNNENGKVVSDEQAYEIMEELSHTFDFGIGNLYANSDVLHYMLTDIAGEIAEILE